MNHGISMLFRAIPLAMAALCFAYGTYVFGTGGAPARFTAGPVVFFLGAICIALYCTAATIIRQIIGSYTAAAKYLFPALGYMCALLTLVCGILILFSRWPGAAVTGHVVCGLALITACVSTAATASTRFLLIPGNSADPHQAVNPAGFTAPQVRTLTAVPCIAAAVAWVWALLLLRNHTTAHLVAGCVMLGIACVCTSLVALIASIARQVRGSYGMHERRRWMTLVLAMGGATFLMGILAFILFHRERIEFVGFVLIGLALICWSISSKVILLAEIWRTEFPLAVRMPIIPVITALTCLFLAAFLFEETPYAPEYFVPSRVLVGFGAVCFTLYSIVSILESGTSRKE